MFKLSKNFRFEASHQLMHHDGKCARLHGHSWTGYIEVMGKNLIKSGTQEGMLIDYYKLGVVTKEIEEMFDHHHLNDVLKIDMPTSEYVALIIYKALSNALKSLPEKVKVSRVVINETCSSQCTYEP